MRKGLLIVLVGVAGTLILAAAGLTWFLSGDSIRLALEDRAARWLGQPVRIDVARAQLFPRVGIHLTGVRVGDPAALTLSHVHLSTSLSALLGRRIEDATVLVSDSEMHLPLPFALPQSDSGVSSEGASRAAVEVVSISGIALRNVRLHSREREVLVSADSSLDGRRLTLSRFSAESGGTSLLVHGEVDLDPQIDARLDVRADRLDLDELLALAEAFTPERQTSSRSASPAARIAARLTAQSANAGGVDVTGLAAEVEVDGDRVALSPLTFQLFGGRYDGALTARLGDELDATLTSQLHDLDVAQLAAFGGSPETITGTLSASGTFRARGADIAALLSSASGDGMVSILDGTIRRLDLVRTVVLFFGRPAPDTAAASDRFDRIDTGFSLARQVFRADSFALHSRDADVTGSGTLALGSKALEGTLTLSLSEELSAQAGTDLARYTREGNRIVLPAKLGGTIEAPQLTIDTAAAARRGIRNEVERRLKGILGR